MQSILPWMGEAYSGNRPTLIWDDQKIVAFVVAFISHKLSKTTEKSFKRQRLITIRIWKRYLLQRTFMASD